MKIDTIFSLVLGGLGTILGIINFYTTRKERIQKQKQGYAITLLGLQPILDFIKGMPSEPPLYSPEITQESLINQFENLDELFDNYKEKLITLFTEIVSIVMKIRYISQQIRLNIAPKTPSSELNSLISEFYFLAFELACYRHFAPQLNMPLHGQSPKSIDNITGDSYANEFIRRARLFRFYKD